MADELFWKSCFDGRWQEGEYLAESFRKIKPVVLNNRIYRWERADLLLIFPLPSTAKLLSATHFPESISMSDKGSWFQSVRRKMRQETASCFLGKMHLNEHSLKYYKDREMFPSRTCWQRPSWEIRMLGTAWWSTVGWWPWYIWQSDGKSADNSHRTQKRQGL